MGRFGERKKVRLSIMVDKWISDALGKIRSKKSVSSLVNGLLGVTIMQFDPGPSSPLIYELRVLFKKHLLEAEISGDAQSIACIEFLESQLVPYYDLAEVVANDDKGEDTQSMVRRSTALSCSIRTDFATATSRQNMVQVSKSSSALLNHSTFIEPGSATMKHDYNWYSVPRICHAAPMGYSQSQRIWICAICGRRYHDE